MPYGMVPVSPTGGTGTIRGLAYDTVHRYHPLIISVFVEVLSRIRLVQYPRTDRRLQASLQNNPNNPNHLNHLNYSN